MHRCQSSYTWTIHQDLAIYAHLIFRFIRYLWNRCAIRLGRDVEFHVQFPARLIIATLHPSFPSLSGPPGHLVSRNQQVHLLLREHRRRRRGRSRGWSTIGQAAAAAATQAPASRMIQGDNRVVSIWVVRS